MESVTNNSNKPNYEALKKDIKEAIEEAKNYAEGQDTTILDDLYNIALGKHPAESYAQFLESFFGYITNNSNKENYYNSLINLCYLLGNISQTDEFNNMQKEDINRQNVSNAEELDDDNNFYEELVEELDEEEPEYENDPYEASPNGRKSKTFKRIISSIGIIAALAAGHYTAKHLKGKGQKFVVPTKPTSTIMITAEPSKAPTPKPTVKPTSTPTPEPTVTPTHVVEIADKSAVTPTDDTQSLSKKNTPAPILKEKKTSNTKSAEYIQEALGIRGTNMTIDEIVEAKMLANISDLEYKNIFNSRSNILRIIRNTGTIISKLGTDSIINKETKTNHYIKKEDFDSYLENVLHNELSDTVFKNAYNKEERGYDIYKLIEIINMGLDDEKNAKLYGMLFNEIIINTIDAFTLQEANDEIKFVLLGFYNANQDRIAVLTFEGEKNIYGAGPYIDDTYGYICAEVINKNLVIRPNGNEYQADAGVMYYSETVLMDYILERSDIDVKVIEYYNEEKNTTEYYLFINEYIKQDETIDLFLLENDYTRCRC